MQKNWREESIKTRIETQSGEFLDILPVIEEKNPLKQGLKQMSHRAHQGRQTYWREESIKTRIETEIWRTGVEWGEIEEKNPLKQGLKQYCGWWWYCGKYRIEEKNPLKQGSKLQTQTIGLVPILELKRRIH